MDIEKFTIGMGDRFAHQGNAQLQAVLTAREHGICVFPTWNKSFREHKTVGSEPQSLRREADAAVNKLGWEEVYYVDADHIGMKTVDAFIEGSNFYTLDVADFVQAEVDRSDADAFVRSVSKYFGALEIPGIEEAFSLDEATARECAAKYLRAIKEAGTIYRHIAERKGADHFVTEVSVDETDQPQTPCELFLILAMIAGEGIPAQTIAPKFTGRFNKGVDYAGDLQQFEKEFDQDLYVIAFAVAEFGLPPTLKLSVHSGSDKFSLYPIIKKLVEKHEAGLHVKTAGTTWLEEVIGLVEAGGEGLDIAKEIYVKACERFEELTAPYATVIDIDADRLPPSSVVIGWSSQEYVQALRHVQSDPQYNPHFRQLIHVGYKVAAEMGERYLDALKANESIIARNVTTNLWERHIRAIFPA